MSLESALLGIFTDPTYGIPLTIAVALTAFAGWWSRLRTVPLPSATLSPPPEVWRHQLDALVYSNLSQGRYSSAVDGLGRCLAVAVRNRFHVQINRGSDGGSSEVDRVLPRQLPLQVLIRDLNRAYTSASWAEQPGWLALRWTWLNRRQQRRAARDFTVLTKHVTTALGAIEAQ
jgi:hypothetical protein